MARYSIGYGKATVATLVVAGAALALTGCSTGTTTENPSASTVAPIAGSELVLSGNPAKGSDLLLNGELANTSSDPITVVGGSAYFATQLQVIKNVDSGGKKSVQTGVTLEIPGSGKAALSPAGYEIKVLKLTEALKVGTTVPLNITLSTGKTMTVQAKVGQ